jgi:hypothetical protein
MSEEQIAALKNFYQRRDAIDGLIAALEQYQLSVAERPPIRPAAFQTRRSCRRGVRPHSMSGVAVSGRDSV